MIRLLAIVLLLASMLVFPAVAVSASLEIEFVFEPLYGKTVVSYNIFKDGNFECNSVVNGEGTLDCESTLEVGTVYDWNLEAVYNDASSSGQSSQNFRFPNVKTRTGLSVTQTQISTGTATTIQ